MIFVKASNNIYRSFFFLFFVFNLLDRYLLREAILVFILLFLASWIPSLEVSHCMYTIVNVAYWAYH